jgi:hypothetical protein
MGSDYAPFPLDGGGGGEPQGDCQTYLVEYSVFIPNVFDPPLITSISLPGFPYDVYSEPSPGSPGSQNYGILHFENDEGICVSGAKFVAVQSGEAVVEVEILSVTLQ